MTKSTNKEKDPLYFYLTGNWYKGNMPNFYDSSTLESTAILESNYEIIKKEVLDFYEKDPEYIKPNWTTYGYVDYGWRNLSLYAFGLKFPNHIQHFPQLAKVIEKIPNLITAQIAVIYPGTRVKAHFGDTNAIIRSHLGLVIPGKYPDLGFRNGSQERCWEEGKVLSLCIAHRHYVWNYTEHKRLILLIDTIHPDFASKKYYIAAGLISSSLLKIIAAKFPNTKKYPKWFIRLFHKILLLPIGLYLIIQDKFNINLAPLIVSIKNKSRVGDVHI
jgi:hypothetical protein